MGMFIVQKKKQGLERLIDSAAAVGVGWRTPVVSALGVMSSSPSTHRQ